MSRFAATCLACSVFGIGTIAVVAEADTPTDPGPTLKTVRALGAGAEARERALLAENRRLRGEKRVLLEQRRDLHARLRQRWAPTVDYALRLASAVTGISYWELRTVSWCESRHDPTASNGRYRGLFQLGWSPFGLDPYDPVANALSAAMTVARDGSWRQWTCRP